MVGRGAWRGEKYVVPAGKRAVVRHVLLQQLRVEPQEMYFKVHGIAVFSLIQGAIGFKNWECRYTVFAGESIEVLVLGIDGAYAVDGFLFDDTSGSPPTDHENVIDPIPHAGKLPADLRYELLE